MFRRVRSCGEDKKLFFSQQLITIYTGTKGPQFPLSLAQDWAMKLAITLQDAANLVRQLVPPRQRANELLLAINYRDKVIDANTNSASKK